MDNNPQSQGRCRPRLHASSSTCAYTVGIYDKHRTSQVQDKYRTSQVQAPRLIEHLRVYSVIHYIIHTHTGYVYVLYHTYAYGLCVPHRAPTRIQCQVQDSGINVHARKENCRRRSRSISTRIPYAHMQNIGTWPRHVSHARQDAPSWTLT